MRLEWSIKTADSARLVLQLSRVQLKKNAQFAKIGRKNKARSFSVFVYCAICIIEAHVTLILLRSFNAVIGRYKVLQFLSLPCNELML